MQTLTKKYGLMTAIAMVVGTVIGSGVFFKAQDILTRTEGDLPISVLAWICGGFIMLVCVLAFSQLAGKYSKVGGLVDYAEATVGSKYAYFVGWFVSTIYLPAMTGVLAWVSARFTLDFVNSVAPGAIADTAVGAECMVLTLLYLVASYTLNTLAPKGAGKFQVSATIIKLIPLVLMIVVGIIAGLVSGKLGDNFAAATAIESEVGRGTHFFSALVSTAFAYEGWIIATTVNAEIKDEKRNLPIALTVGSLIIISIYVLYNVGIAGGIGISELLEHGVSRAFTNLFGSGFGAVLNLFVAVSCLGTLNGLMLANTRALYALAARGEGPLPRVFSKVDEATSVPTNSAIFGLLCATFWFVYFYASSLSGWFGKYGFDASELPIVTTYLIYLPIIIQMIRKSDAGVFKRFVIPCLAFAGSVFMVIAACIAHGMGVVYYLIVFAVISVIGAIVQCRKKK